MNVLLTGASGFIGGHLAAALRAAGHTVIEVRRDAGGDATAVQADFTRDLSARDWLPKLVGVDAVINAVGILREHGQQSFECIHKRAPQALFTSCVAAGIRRVVQISALGADRGMTRYFLSKRAADDYLATLPLEWTIVRPAMVFGSGGSSARLFAMLAHLPLVPLPGRGEQRLQPIHIDDLTEAVVRILGDAKTHRTRIESGRSAVAHCARAAHSVARSDAAGSGTLRANTDVAREGRRTGGGREHAVAVGQRNVVDAGSGDEGDPAATRWLLGREPRAVASVNARSVNRG